MDIEVGPFRGALVALEKLAGVLREQKDAFFSKSVRRDVEILESDLGIILIHLVSLDVSSTNAQAWAISVGELTYDVEDWVDLLALRLGPSSSRFPRWIRRGVHRFATLPARHSIASELLDLKERVAELSEQRILCTIPSMPVAQADEPVDPRLATIRFVDAGSLVGLNGPIEELTKMVASAGGKQAELKVVSVVGMAGSGKTTLAAAVYRQVRQHNCFELQAFVSVGQKPHAVEKALLDMLSELGDRPPKWLFEDDFDPLITGIRHILENKRYLVVVDDCNEEHWGLIKWCFPDNYLGSRIITTTVNLEFAKEFSPGSGDCIYNIGLLNEVDSKKFILDTAFGTGHGCPKHLEDVLAKITRRCGGLPLALVTVASMLHDKSSKDEWDRLVESRWLSLPDAHAQKMKQVINRGYNNLSVPLRICLLYLGIFPRNEVDVDRLVRILNAEGYIGDPKQDVGIYLNELININMVTPLFWNKDGIKCCRLHPVMYDFIVCKSMENNFATLMDAELQDGPSTGIVRRLSLQSSEVLTQEGSIMDLSHARSVTIFGQANSVPPLTNLSVVRALDLEGCVGPVCLDGLDKLQLLRYLSLKGTDVSELPAAIGELRWLEALDVRSTKVKKLPPSILRLRDTLKTLLFSCEGMTDSIETTTRIVKHCRRLENLATIDLREHHESFVKELGDLSDLRMLEITWSFHQCTEGAYRKSLLSAMIKWRQLRSLTIHCGRVGCCMEFLGSLSHPPELLEKFKVTAGGFVSVPKWIQFLNHLSFLQITIYKTGTDNMKILRDIPQLQSLILGLDVPREPLVIGSEGFSKLLRFSVDCPLPWLTFLTGAMPRLTHLQLELCSAGSTNPESVPSGISNLQGLTEVVLLYNQKWCADSSSVRMTVDAVKRQVAKHHNLIDLIINGTKADVQKVDEEMKITTEVQSGDAGGEIVRTTVEMTRGEIEIEAECGNICSTY